MKDTLLKSRITVSLLWIAVLFNILFADILSIMIELVDGGVVQIPMDVTTMMAIAAVINNLPVLMIVLTWILPQKTNWWMNVSVAILTMLYVIGGGALLPHYIIMASIETLLLVSIIVISSRWKLNS